MSGFLCDTNVWLALSLGPHVHHEAALQWLDTVDQPDSIHFCRATQQSFLRLLTTSAVLRPYGLGPLDNETAWLAYESFIADERITPPLGEPPRAEAAWRRYATRNQAAPKLWMDAYLAGLAQTASQVLVTTDRGFTQFVDLRVQLIGDP